MRCYDGRPFRSSSFCSLIMLTTTICLFLVSFSTAEEPDFFFDVQKRLIMDGFKASEITELYNDPAVFFETGTVSTYFIYRESELNYDQFLAGEVLKKVSQYMTNHQHAFKSAQQAFGVDPRYIASILMVETNLGQYVGNTHVFNVLSTIAALSNQDVKDYLWAKVKGSSRLTRAEFDAKAEKKSSWAYDELFAFLTYMAETGTDPLTVVGSMAGAMGYAQFMPSNILKFGQDGDDDGTVDLFTHADAIMSIARYLNHYGFKENMDDQQAFDVVYSYNHSEYYVNTILGMVRLLEN